MLRVFDSVAAVLKTKLFESYKSQLFIRESKESPFLDLVLQPEGEIKINKEIKRLTM